jgi:hypothetical protein
METFQQLKKHLDLNIVPQCAQACQNAPLTLNKQDALKRLVRVCELVEKEVLFPLEKINGNTSPRVERRVFKNSVLGLMDFLADNISLISHWHRSRVDLELGLQNEEAKERDCSVAQWDWLNKREPEPKLKVPGAWPDTD